MKGATAKFNTRETYLESATAKFNTRETQKFRGFLEPRNLVPAKFSTFKVHGNGSNLGYRRIWAHLISMYSFIIARREDVRLALLHLDPEGVSRYKRRKLRRRKYRVRARFRRP